MLLALPHGDASVEAGTFSAALSLQCYQLFGWVVVVKSGTLDNAGQGRKAVSVSLHAAEISGWHWGPTANKNLV